MLGIVRKCLDRQTFKDFEWLIVGPISSANVVEPPKRSGDYYSLNKAWNTAFKVAEGNLFINIVDGIWFPPDTLEKLWSHYESNPKICVTCVGDQYDKLENGKPEHMMWRDPRKRTDFGAFYEVSPREMELCVASIPREAVYGVGGIDEEFDKYAALSEKEMCFRMEQLGYKFYIDQGIEYRAIHHPRLSEEWDKKYFEGYTYYDECLKQIGRGERVKLQYV